MTNVVFALPEDRQQVLQLQADSADLNQEKHRGIYIGHVELDQGSTHLRAAEAITEGNSDNKLIRAIAKGNQEEQAHYWTLTAEDKPPLHAYADKIYYYPESHLIELIGQARIEQGQNSFSAPKITYDTERQHVLTQRDKKARTVITIYPEKKS
ncbi:lipopolysaccharide transport periplasmic protein LptA [Legionella nagasakiensis]|uniref:lipopolysaccharide transport periplasmic protein LptA n=1 Tax=Legionella nagasakiensis TaxID=535290 RepID=UPI001F5FAE40|nr:lipopolysaccharide transport periplasmic protein LptA [Legionella nagasakiensis]